MIALYLGCLGALAIAAAAEIAPGSDRIAAPFPACLGVFLLLHALLDLLVERRFPARHLTRIRLALFLSAHAFALLVLGGATWVSRDLGWAHAPVPTLALLLLPAAGLALAAGVVTYTSPRRRREERLEAALQHGASRRPGSQGLVGFLLARLRNLSAPLLVLFGLTAGSSIAEEIPSFNALRSWEPAGDALLASGALLFLCMFAPLLLLLAVPTERFPGGPLRDLLRKLAREGNGRGAESRPRLLDWNTRRHLNACAVGFSPAVGLVLFTRGILEHLSPVEIAGVYAHEHAHLARGHLTSFAGLGTAFLLGGQGLLACEAFLPRPLIWTATGVFTLLFWGPLFGRLSRTFELEADLAAARAVGFVPYAGALEKVALLTGGGPARGGWRHPSIATRLAALEQAAAHPELGDHLDRNWRGLRRKIWVLPATALAAVLALSASGLSRRVDPAAAAADAVAAAESYAGTVAVARQRTAAGPSPWYLLQRDPPAIEAVWTRLVTEARGRVAALGDGDGPVAQELGRRIDAISGASGPAP